MNRSALLVVLVAASCAPRPQPSPPTTPDREPVTDAVATTDAGVPDQPSQSAEARVDAPAFWCSAYLEDDDAGPCHTSREECEARRRAAGRAGQAGGECRPRPAAVCSYGCPGGLCLHACDATERGCEATLKSGAFRGSPCVEFPPPPKPFMPLGRGWWCFDYQEGGGGLAFCFRAEQTCATASGRMRAGPSATVGPCERQVRAACYVTENLMQDSVSPGCFARVEDCRSQAAYVTRGGDQRLVAACELWE